MTTYTPNDFEKRKYPLGSCIHCGLNIWESDILDWFIEPSRMFESYNTWEAVCQCAHCKQIVTSDELIPF